MIAKGRNEAMQKDKYELKEFESLLETFPNLHHEIPLSYEKIELGVLSIDFNATSSEKEDPLKKVYLWGVRPIILSIAKFLRNDIRITLDLIERSDINLFVVMLYLKFDEYLEFHSYFSHKDEDIYDFVQTEGPISLRNSSIQDKIYAWISDQKTGRSKIQKLCDALLKHGKTQEQKPVKRGRPEYYVIKKFGTEWICKMHSDFRKLLGMVKKSKDRLQTDGLDSLIQEAFNTVIDERMKELEEDPSSHEKLQEFKEILDYYRHIEVPNPITEYIKIDNELKSWFESFRWNPNELAIEIIAKMLNASSETVRNLVYRKK